MKPPRINYALPQGIKLMITGNYDIFKVVETLTYCTHLNPMANAEIEHRSGIDSATIRGICLKLSNRHNFLHSKPAKEKPRSRCYRLWYIAPEHHDLACQLIRNLIETNNIPPVTSNHRKDTRDAYRQVHRDSTFYTVTPDEIGPYTRLIITSTKYPDGIDRYVRTAILNDTERYPRILPTYTSHKLIDEGLL